MRNLKLIKRFDVSNNDIFFSKSSIQDIMQSLKLYGICVVKDYLNKELLNDINEEFDFFFKANEKMLFKKEFKKIEFPGTKVISLEKKNIIDSSLISIKKVFYSEYFKNIVKNYFYPSNVDLNDMLYMSLDSFNNHKYISDWHFDQLHALKFNLSLCDTDESNGAFQYSLGSHHEGFFRSIYCKIRNKSYIANKIDIRHINSAYSINTRAGDLIIFDTNGTHRGGRIKKKRIRKVIRGHSHRLIENNLKNNFFRRLISSRLNLFKYSDFRNATLNLVNENLQPYISDTSKKTTGTKITKHKK